MFKIIIINNLGGNVEIEVLYSSVYLSKMVDILRFHSKKDVLPFHFGTAYLACIFNLSQIKNIIKKISPRY